MHPDWLSNTYLVADREGGTGVVIDAGGPSGPLLEAAERLELDVEHLLLTHHHHDHVAEADAWRRRFDVETYAHPIEAELLEGVDHTIEPGEVISAGGLEIGSLHTPGHTAGMLNFVVNDRDVFTGDTLFRGSVGGVRAPGSTSFEDLRRSIMDVLMALPEDTQPAPGAHRSDDRGRGVGAERVRAALARARRRGRRALHGRGRGGDAGAVGARLRRWAQGLGALAGRPRRHRARQPGEPLIP